MMIAAHTTGRPTLPALPLISVGRAELGLAFLLDSGLRGGQIAEFWDHRGPTKLTYSGRYALSTTEALLVRIALSIDTPAPAAGRKEDLGLLLNGLTGRSLQALVRLLQAIGGGLAAQQEYCARVFTAACAEAA